MESINISNCKIHPIYDRYASNEDGIIVDLYKKRLLKVQLGTSGYYQIFIYVDNIQKTYSQHRTGEIDYFHSMYSIQRDIGINCGIVKMCCEGLNRVKTGKSKINGNSYKFEYIDTLPDDYNKPKRIVKKYAIKNNEINNIDGDFSENIWFSGAN
jgi:hypothetical protein